MRRVLFAIFTTVAGLVGLLSFKTQATSAVGSPAAITTPTPTGTSSTGNGIPKSATTTNSSTARSSSTVKKSATKTVTGSVVDTQYGPIQVRITVTNGAITKAAVTQYPSNDPRSYQINAYAIPILEKETIGATSANLDMVSGATYTSTGYLQSLQSAVNKAGI
jgi:uncharacterized protein with FMN-binding domain